MTVAERATTQTEATGERCAALTRAAESVALSSDAVLEACVRRLVGDERRAALIATPSVDGQHLVPVRSFANAPEVHTAFDEWLRVHPLSLLAEPWRHLAAGDDRSGVVPPTTPEPQIELGSRFRLPGSLIVCHTWLAAPICVGGALAGVVAIAALAAGDRDLDQRAGALQEAARVASLALHRQRAFAQARSACATLNERLTAVIRNGPTWHDGYEQLIGDMDREHAAVAIFHRDGALVAATERFARASGVDGSTLRTGGINALAGLGGDAMNDLGHGRPDSSILGERSAGGGWQRLFLVSTTGRRDHEPEFITVASTDLEPPVDH